MKHRLDYSDKKVTIKKKSVINAHLIQEYSIFSEVDWGIPSQNYLDLKKTLQNPWMIKYFWKSSNWKQKLYKQIVKKRSPPNENIYKAYKSLFESQKKKSKKYYYTRPL